MVSQQRSAKRPRHAMPAFVRAALAGHGLMDAYEVRPPCRKNDYLGWIKDAKREATRQRRLAQMIGELEGGRMYMNMDWSGGRAQE